MKKLLLIIFTTSLLFGALSQNVWIDQSAEWYHNYANVAEEGFIHSQYIGDTNILGFSCQKITQRKDVYQYTSPTSGLVFIGSVNLKPMYTYSSNDSVFYYNNGGFNLLWDFGAQVADTWVIDVNSDTLPCSKNSSIVTVDSIGNMLINGTNYRWIALSTKDSSTHSLTGKFIERFGNINYGGLFPTKTHTGITCDTNQIYEFDSYSFHYFNDQSFSYASDSSLSCSQPTVSISEEKRTNNSFSIYPNPISSKGKLNIQTNNIEANSITILNALGKIVLNKKYVKSIDLNLQKGVYLIQLFNDNEFIGIKQLIVTQ